MVAHRSIGCYRGEMGTFLISVLSVSCDHRGPLLQVDNDRPGPPAEWGLRNRGAVPVAC